MSLEPRRRALGNILRGHAINDLPRRSSDDARSPG